LKVQARNSKHILGNVVVLENAVDQFPELNIKIVKIRTGGVPQQRWCVTRNGKLIKWELAQHLVSSKQQQTWITDIANLYNLVHKAKEF
jgi:hypothetical protein